MQCKHAAPSSKPRNPDFKLIRCISKPTLSSTSTRIHVLGMKTDHNESQPQSHSLSRRKFLRAAAVAAGTGAGISIVPRHVLGGEGNVPPSEKLNIAGIGIGGQGRADLEALENQNIVALCDVDWDYAAP